MTIRIGLVLSGALALAVSSVAAAQIKVPASATKVSAQKANVARSRLARSAFAPKPGNAPVKAVVLTKKRAAGVNYLMSPGKKRLEALPAYFESLDDVAGSLFTASLVARLPAAPQGAAAVARYRRVGGVLEKAGLKAADSDLAAWRGALKRSTRQSFPAMKRRSPPPGAGAATYSYTASVTPMPAGAIMTIPDWLIPDPVEDACTAFSRSAEWSWGWNDSASLTFTYGYPCWDWPPWCEDSYTITFSVSLGCDAGVALGCCGAEVWGACQARACAGPLCAGCTGSVGAAAGLLTEVAGGQCNYGLPLTVSASCDIFGVTLWSESYEVSPWAIPGPCPPDGFCK